VAYGYLLLVDFSVDVDEDDFDEDDFDEDDLDEETFGEDDRAADPLELLLPWDADDAGLPDGLALLAGVLTLFDRREPVETDDLPSVAGWTALLFTFEGVEPFMFEPEFVRELILLLLLPWSLLELGVVFLLFSPIFWPVFELLTDLLLITLFPVEFAVEDSRPETFPEEEDEVFSGLLPELSLYDEFLPEE
jgi:hypothetical protein